jgi:hypothetical protein
MQGCCSDKKLCFKDEYAVDDRPMNGGWRAKRLLGCRVVPSSVRLLQVGRSDLHVSAYRVSRRPEIIRQAAEQNRGPAAGPTRT